MNNTIDLSKLVEDVTPVLESINFSQDIKENNIDEEHTGYMQRENSYYKGLACIINHFGYTDVCEIGACRGTSAVALARFADKVNSYDVNLGLLFDIKDVRINFKKLNGNLDCLNIDFDWYDFIFVDVDHDGYTEQKIHEVLLKKYKGLVAYDDIFLNDRMKSFWEGITNNKISVPWHDSGFGIVEY